MRSIWMAIALLASGCIVYEEELVEEEECLGADCDGPNRPGEAEEDDDPAEDSDATYSVWLSPGGALAGDVAIISLEAEGDIDLATVDQVTFIGDSDVEILATDARSAYEFLLTIDVPDDASLSANDLLIEFDDERVLFIEEAFSIVATEGEIPAKGATAEGCN